MSGEKSYNDQQPQQRTASALHCPVDSGTLSDSKSCAIFHVTPTLKHIHDPTYLTAIPTAESVSAHMGASSPPPSAQSFQIQQLVDPSDLHKLYSLQPGLKATLSPPTSSKGTSSKPLSMAQTSTAATASVASPSTSGMTKLKLHAADFAHRMDDTAVLRSRRDWSYVRDGWPAKTPLPLPMVSLPMTKQQPNHRRGGNVHASLLTANSSDSNQTVVSFLNVTCLPPGLIDLDPIARTQLVEPDPTCNAKSRLLRESTPTPLQQQQQPQQASASISPSANSPPSKSRADAARKLARPAAAPASDPVLQSRSVRPQSADAAGRRNTLAPTTQIMTLPTYSPLSDTEAPPQHSPSPPASNASPFAPTHSHTRHTRPSSAGGSGSSNGFPSRPRSAGLRGMLPLKRNGSGESTGSGSGGSSSSSLGSNHIPQHHRHHHRRHHHRSASPGPMSAQLHSSSVPTALYSPSRQLASGSQTLGPSVNRLPGLRKLSSLFPGSNAPVLSSCHSNSNLPASQSIVQPTVSRTSSNSLTGDLAADMQSLGLSGVRCMSSSPPSPSGPVSAGVAPSRAGFASSSPTGSSSSPKPPSKRPAAKSRNHRTAAAAVATLMHATPASTPAAAAAAAAAAIVQVAAADVIHAATVGGVVGVPGTGGGGGGGGGGMASVGIGVSSKYNRMSALPRLEFARVKYAT